MLKPRNSLAKPLTIMQANIRKGATSHEIILIQEPYIFSDRTRKILKTHFIYKSFTPLDD
jgi:hypothetical protein